MKSREKRSHKANNNHLDLLGDDPPINTISSGWFRPVLILSWLVHVVLRLILIPWRERERERERERVETLLATTYASQNINEMIIKPPPLIKGRGLSRQRMTLGALTVKR